jgi:hypothetical protein
MNHDLKNYWELSGTLDLGKYPKNQEMFFSLTDTDTEENYDKNPHPNWAKFSVKYKYNSQGFRSCEFIVNPGKPVILAFGCSHTVGVGIPVEDNWPEQFGNKYFPDHIVYNAGLGGASADTVARLASNLIPIIKPDIVAILWPEMHRFETYHHGMYENDTKFNGPWSDDDFKIHFKDNNAYNNHSKNKLIVRLLQTIYNFKLVELDAAKEFEIRKPGAYLTARDGQHFCGWWHRDVAEDFYNEYTKK